MNAWNEWTEGSYLLPDTTHRLGNVEAMRDVLGTH
ncbi:glycoside hydrolase family 99-like domain-containing protein [Kribbella pittospori]|nr:glycoside hydrolase family 99-like domain-containing protein [Kribbella pittospori]